MTDEEILRSIEAGEGPARGDLEAQRLRLPQYVFYKDTPGGRHFECSACLGSYDISYAARTTTPDDRLALRACHREKGVCPKCKRPVSFMQEGRTKEGVKLRDSTRVASLYAVDGNTAAAVCTVLYRKFEPLGRTRFVKYIDCVYIFRPGWATRWEYYGNTAYDFTCEASKRWSPFTPDGMMPSPEPYTLTGIERIRDCFLRFSGVDIWQRENGLFMAVDYLYAYCSHPQFEYLMKSGFGFIVRHIIIYRDFMKSIFDWSKKGAAFFRRVSPGELRELAAMSFTIEVLKAREYFRLCAPLTLTEADEIIKNTVWHTTEIKQRLRRYRVDPRRFIKYIDKQQELYKAAFDNGKSYGCHAAMPFMRTAPSEWVDYIRMAEELGYNISDSEVFMPRSLMDAHDRTAEALNAFRIEQEAKKHAEEEAAAAELYGKRCSEYGYENSLFTVVIPKNLTEIVREGQRQRHCVAGYCSRHASGKCTICFIRRKSEVDKNYVTVELGTTGKVVQARGYRNGTPEKECLLFIERWQAEIRKRLEKQKTNTEKEKKKNENANTVNVAS